MLSPQQQEIVRLKKQGLGAKKIAQTLGVSESTVKTNLRRIKEKLARLQGGDKDNPNDPSQYPCALFEDQNLEEMISEVPGAPRMTVNQFQVLALAGKGLTVKQVAKKLNKSENAVRCTLKQKSISAKDFSKRKLTAEERERVEKIKPPAEKRISWADAALLRAYINGEIARDHLAGVEVVLRAKGYIRRTPNINRANAKHLKTIIAGSREKVLRVPADKAKTAQADLAHNNAKLLCSVTELEYTHEYDEPKIDSYRVYSVSAAALETLLKAL
ncbi:RNA polymerase sigma factor SigX [Thermincola ferriacetica]|uniref:RNA polymerase sigma factor SigX n=1 Tax=Thermincola ferriacetica TaxID=281456 RepID=A0A0L6VZB8_9FIRM|nr:sigma factor-like helix-turn-helix DNA-binding protein [Thermincola ferriacetica]KNZ68672.1 RNA polymerase sigma factor SigX [Thermincola ferriacetica]